MPDNTPRPQLPPLPDSGAGMDAERQRRADAIARREAYRLASQSGGSLPGTIAGAANRPGLPESASGPGREEAVADGLYEWGESARGTGIRPVVPEGEADSFDLPALPYMRVRRPAGEREAEAGE